MAAQCATEVDDNPLWNFALAFYASKDVQELLLKLQNDYQQDTLLVLTALWLGQQGQPWQLSHSQLDGYFTWRQQVVWALRATRKAISKDNGSAEQLALRQQIQKDEIRAEQIALHQLYLLHTGLTCQAFSSQQVLENLFSQARLGQTACRQTGPDQTADIKKEALEPLFKQLADLLVSQ